MLTKRARIEAIVLPFLVTCVASQAHTLVVGQTGVPCPNAQYTTIGQAITAASAGDVIQVCPALYPEQLTITKPLTIEGIQVNGVNRVMIQPTLLGMVGTGVAAVTVMNTNRVTLNNLSIDASYNTVTDCTSLATVHFENASGEIKNSAITGAKLASPASCTTNKPSLSNGFGVLVDTSDGATGPFQVFIANNSIHNFSKDGVYATGPSSVSVVVYNNSIQGIGPSSGFLQFGVFIWGPTGYVTYNRISQGACGSLSPTDCSNLRSEGIVLRDAGEGSVVDCNVITNVQSGIFLNGGNKYFITRNTIQNVDGLFNGIHMQYLDPDSLTNVLVEGNTVSNVLPLSNQTCGIGEVVGPNIYGNKILNNTINDAYCGVGSVSTDVVLGTITYNTLYPLLDAAASPPPVEP
jgi:Right handed beta helix region